MALRSLLGVDQLVGHNGAKVSVASLEGTITYLYFSAHWCPPCRGFTPVLAKLYNKLKAAGKKFEIIFVSSDKSQEQFDEYFAEHPWIALPWIERAAKDKLSRRLKVNGIPTLAIVDEAGKVVSTNGRSAVGNDPNGENFPWLPQSAAQILAGANFVSAKKGSITFDEVKAHAHFALYFSAHWCPPCRGFTPQLATVYNTMKERGVDFEVIFVSSDQSEEDFNEYLSEMPWYALPLGDPRIQKLSEACNVEGIPTLATFAADGTLITTEAREDVSSDPTGAKFPWAPEPLPAVCPLTGNSKIVDALNRDICVILALNGATNASTALTEFNQAVAKFDAINSKLEDKVKFFVVDNADGEKLYGRVTEVLGCKATPGTSTVLLMNLSNNKANRFVSGELSADNIETSVKAFHAAQNQ